MSRYSVSSALPILCQNLLGRSAIRTIGTGTTDRRRPKRLLAVDCGPSGGWSRPECLPRKTPDLTRATGGHHLSRPNSIPLARSRWHDSSGTGLPRQRLSASLRPDCLNGSRCGVRFAQRQRVRGTTSGRQPWYYRTTLARMARAREQHYGAPRGPLD